MRRHARQQTRPGARQDTARQAERYLEGRAGQRLEPEVRTAAEARFGHSFANVRVHADAGADRAAAGLHARAFALGSDLVFAAGEFEPGSPAGQALLLHELTHVVQNEAAPDAFRPGREVSTPGDPAEQQALAVSRGAAATGVPAAPGALVARAPAQEGKSDGGWYTGILPFLSSAAGMTESYHEGMLEHRDWFKPIDQYAKTMGKRDMMGTMGDGLGLAGGMVNAMSGFYGLANGGGVNSGLDAAKGTLDAVSGWGGLIGSSPVEGAAGLVSSGIDVGRGIHKIATGDVAEATDGAYQTAGGIASGISSWGDATKNPVAMGVGRSLGLGLTVGQGIVSGSDSISRERGYFADDAGVSQSGSSEAADWGRSVDEAFGHDNWLLDKMGGVAGGLVAAGGGIANSAYSYGHRAVDAVGDALFGGPSIMDMMAMYRK